MTVGGVFKATIPDESDEERRELERSVNHCLLQTDTPRLNRTCTCRLVLNAGSKKKARDKKAKEEKEKASGGGLFGWGRTKEKEKDGVSPAAPAGTPTATEKAGKKS
jgi:hypothetical protein